MSMTRDVMKYKNHINTENTAYPRQNYPGLIIQSLNLCTSLRLRGTTETRRFSLIIDIRSVILPFKFFYSTGTKILMGRR